MARATPKKSLWGRVSAKAVKARQRMRFLRSVNHLHGPAPGGRSPDDVVVVALVRNGLFYMDEFLRHYRALGAAQFVFCDNGSTDGTIERLTSEPDTVVLQSLLPWIEVETDFRRHAAETFAAGCWCLYADLDEIFEFEGAGQIGLAGLVHYLSEHGYTALVAQMLEMFPKAPLRDVARFPYDKVLETFRYYDLTAIERFGYHDAGVEFSYFLDQNTAASPDIEVLFGGVRNRVFGELCCLTKHPLVRITGDVVPSVHPHCATHVACADFTALIRHYKFANDPAARDRDTLTRNVILHGEDRKRLDRFGATPDLSLHADTARAYTGLDALCDQGFLVRSAAYRAYLEARANEGGS